MSLSITSDAGRTWRTVYAIPRPDGVSPQPNPFELPMLFTSQLRGFAASSIPPAEGQVNAGFFATTDGGVSWTPMAPPAARAMTCPPDDLGPIECMFALPSFSDATHAVLASEVVDGARATVGFDSTADGGSTWQLTTTVDVPIALVAPDSYPKTYALVSTPSGSNWWIASAAGSGVTTRTSTDAGQHWTVANDSPVLGSPAKLAALDATHALLMTEIITADGGETAVYVTNDGGHNWKTLFGS